MPHFRGESASEPGYAGSSRVTISAQMVAGIQPMMVMCNRMQRMPWITLPRRNIASHGARKQMRMLII